MLIISLIVMTSCILFVSASNLNNFKIVCYYTNWAQYRLGAAKYTPNNIDAHLCTHIIYAFATIDAKTLLLSKSEWNDISSNGDKNGMYEQVTSLKHRNPHLKVLLAVGGWTHGSKLFSDMARDTQKRSRFIEHSIEFLLNYKFDGLDVDWEFPALRDSEDRPDDKQHFTLLLKELKSAYLPFNLTLTAAVSAGKQTIESSYEAHKIHKYLDFINLMSYDYAGSGDNYTGHNSPLYASHLVKDKTLNIDWSVRKWLAFGVPRHKLIVGISFYGRSFMIKKGFELCPVRGTPSIGPGHKGTYTNEEGFLAYYEACLHTQRNRWSYVWSNEQKVPFAYSNNEWLGFDDVKSIELKMQYIKEHNLGGAMIWSIDLDDFNGEFCKQDKYPLLRIINHHLNGPHQRRYIAVPNANVNWIHHSKEPLEEQDLYKSDSTPKDLNLFRIITGDSQEISLYCQCKRGVHQLNSHIVINCNNKTLVKDSHLFINDHQQHLNYNKKPIIKKTNEFEQLYFKSKGYSFGSNLILMYLVFIFLIK